MVLVPILLERARQAADAGEWAEFVEAYGGIEAGQRGAISLEKELTGECNEYGEVRAAVVIGVRCGLLVIATRVRVWVFAFATPVQLLTRVQGVARQSAARKIEHQTGPP